jgi:hypothetical protein
VCHLLGLNKKINAPLKNLKNGTLHATNKSEQDFRSDGQTHGLQPSSIASQKQPHTNTTIITKRQQPKQPTITTYLLIFSLLLVVNKK